VRAHAVRAIRLEVESAKPEPSRSRREMRGMENLFQVRLVLRSNNLLAAPRFDGELALYAADLG
jgi:hypothetical protein